MAKKKKKRTRGTGTAPGADPNEQRREKLEARRLAKAEAQRAAMKKAQRDRLLRRMFLIGLLMLTAVFVYRQFQDISGPEEIEGHAISRFDSSGENQHTDQQVTYETTPPVAGEHRGSAPSCGIYGQQMEDELYVHALEHGAVSILYQPTLDPADIEEIEAIASDFDSHVLTMPYEGMEAVIAVSSWGERMDLDELDARAVRTYIDEFRQEGPEDQPCDMAQDQPFEPTAPTPAPTAPATPSPEST